MRSHQEGRQQFTVKFVVGLTSLLQLLFFIKIRNIPLLLLIVSRKSQSWDKRSWKGSLASCSLCSFWSSMGKAVIVLINPQQIPTSFGSVYIAGMPSTYSCATFWEHLQGQAEMKLWKAVGFPHFFFFLMHHYSSSYEIFSIILGMREECSCSNVHPLGSLKYGKRAEWL